MRRTPRFLVSAVAVLGFLGAACGSDDSGATEATTATTAADASTASTPATGVEGDVTVFAAASLSAAFTEMGEAFSAAHPDAHVVLSFAGSSDLAAQIGEGAPADVFASADLSNMTKVTDTGRSSSEPVVFATNIAEIIVEAGNPERVNGVGDLANPDLVVIQCAPEVPCGKYAAQIYANAGVRVTPKSLEENVNGVVTKVTLGEADAGIVYATDVTAAGADAEGVEIPDDINVVAEYPIVALSDAPNGDGAQAFIDFVLSDEGQAILASYGFLAP